MRKELFILFTIIDVKEKSPAGFPRGFLFIPVVIASAAKQSSFSR